MDAQAKVQELRTTYLPQISKLLSAIPHEYTPALSSLCAECDYQLATGGKRLRAIIPLLVAEALGQDPTEVIPFAAACEMLHNATLVHDDVQDGDDNRRGQPTVWKKYGIPAAINCGDAMFYYALLLLQQLAVEPSHLMQLMTFFMSSTLKVINGQELEFALEQKEIPTLDQYEEMVTGKTSGLFALPTVGAAILAGASAATQNALLSASQHLGVLFQIQDDYLDLFGQKGRSFVGSDIAEGKRSFLAVYALNHTSPTTTERLLKILKSPREDTTPEMITEAITIIKESGAQEAALAEIKRHSDLAQAAVAAEPFPGAGELISALVKLLTGQL